MSIKLKIEVSEKLYKDLCRAARNLKTTRKRFITTAIRRLARSNQASGEDITASLNKFFEENPELNNIEAMRHWEN